MAYQFKFPDVGEGIHEGKIVKWHVKEGDEIKADDTIAEVETDKAVVEIPSPVSGKVLKLDHKEGETINVGEILAEIDAPEGDAAPKEEAPADDDAEPEKRESTGVVGALEQTAKGVMKAPSLEMSGAVFGDAPAEEPKKAGAKDITKETIEKEKAKTAPKEEPKKEAETKSAEAKPAASGGVNVPKAGLKAVKKYDMFGYIDRLPYDSVRKAVGEHMVKSMFTIPHVTHTDLADVTDLVALRAKEKKNAEKQDIKLTFLPFFIKATIQALMKHPTLNAELNEEEGQIILKKYYNIGIAVDTEHGLMVPVIKGADKKSILDIAKEIVELADKAHNKKLNPMDMKGGTFTITNIGSAQSGWFATPVINYPQSAILGTGWIQDMVVPVDGKPQVRKMLPLSLTFDHRVLDGAEAALFTKTVKETLEDPGLMLIEEK
mgnify:CR=1 FL=1